MIEFVVLAFCGVIVWILLTAFNKRENFETYAIEARATDQARETVVKQNHFETNKQFEETV